MINSQFFTQRVIILWLTILFHNFHLSSRVSLRIEGSVPNGTEQIPPRHVPGLRASLGMTDKHGCRVVARHDKLWGRFLPGMRQAYGLCSE